MKIKYINKNFSNASLKIIAKANEIIDEYQGMNLDLTLRQLYYQFVSKALIENSERSYKSLAKKISDGRLTGMIDWHSIVDRTRTPSSVGHWDDIQEIIDSSADAYMRDYWEDQAYYIEVWIEKEALIGVIERECRNNNIVSFACKGYVSQSEMHSAAERFNEQRSSGKLPILFYLGDHDPSGIHMTQDVFERLELFMGGVDVQRLALNMDQIEEFNPPPNPTKMSDTRAKGYVAKYGNESWELDALHPTLFGELIRTQLEPYIDRDLWEKVKMEEEATREKIRAFSSEWYDDED